MKLDTLASSQKNSIRVIFHKQIKYCSTLKFINSGINASKALKQSRLCRYKTHSSLKDDEYDK